MNIEINMIPEIIITLGIIVKFSENPMDCGFKTAMGCYNTDKNRITLILTAQEDINETLAHEVGHALFYGNSEVMNFIDQYPNIWCYSLKVYPTKWDTMNESVADYFAEYAYSPDFKYKFPKIQKYFDDKLERFK